ncbi:MAG: hypothetical protein IKX10_05305 [Lachnospiraceae bacterium]|nr:hypothetical protein [Lachnospiraceae bacterium]
MLRTKEILNEITSLEDSKKKVARELERLKQQVPEGVSLRVARHGGSCQYFMREKGAEKTGKYIKKKDLKRAEILAQIEYDEKLIIQLNETLEKLKVLSKGWVEDPFNEAMKRLSMLKRDLVMPIYKSDEAFLSEWKKQEYEGVAFSEEFPEYYTRQGLRVRSKSELILADLLDEMSIPFLYEKPLKLGSGSVHPDFTLLNMFERREVYWEHFGMMDDMEYRNNAFLKIRKYESAGLFQHVSLIWTFETGKYPLNTREVRKMLKNLKTTLGY